jgi:hypothetical protein
MLSRNIWAATQICFQGFMEKKLTNFPLRISLQYLERIHKFSAYVVRLPLRYLMKRNEEIFKAEYKLITYKIIYLLFKNVS